MIYDTHIYLVVKKIKNIHREEIILDSFSECFSNYEEAVAYVRTHFRAKKVSKQCKFETEDFVYEIKRIPIVNEYMESNDQIILREGE